MGSMSAAIKKLVETGRITAAADGGLKLAISLPPPECLKRRRSIRINAFDGLSNEHLMQACRLVIDDFHCLETYAEFRSRKAAIECQPWTRLFGVGHRHLIAYYCAAVLFSITA